MPVLVCWIGMMGNLLDDPHLNQMRVSTRKDCPTSFHRQLPPFGVCFSELSGCLGGMKISFWWWWRSRQWQINLGREQTGYSKIFVATWGNRRKLPERFWLHQFTGVECLVKVFPSFGNDPLFAMVHWCWDFLASSRAGALYLLPSRFRFRTSHVLWRKCNALGCLFLLGKLVKLIYQSVIGEASHVLECHPQENASGFLIDRLYHTRHNGFCSKTASFVSSFFFGPKRSATVSLVSVFCHCQQILWEVENSDDLFDYQLPCWSDNSISIPNVTHPPGQPCPTCAFRVMWIWPL